jgi:ribonuclease P protein component
MTTPAFRLPREHRLRSQDDFRQVYDRRRSVSDEWLIIYGRENGLPHLRLGLSVSRKVGGAVERNRLRRLYREAFRLTHPELAAGLDIILIPRKGEAPPLEQVQQSLRKLIPQLARRLARETPKHDPPSPRRRE